MLRHLVSAVALACSCSALAAVEISLPAPSLAEIHPDGARLHHRIELPAGVHQVTLPDGCASELTVLGAASWTAVREARERQRPALPKELVGMLAERNRLESVERELSARATALAAADDDIEALLPRLARADKPDPARWQQALDATLAAHAKLDADRLAQRAARERLLDRAEPLAPTPGQAADLLAMGADAPLTLGGDELSRRWNGLPTLIEQVRVLVVTAPGGAIDIVEERSDLRWTPASSVIVDAGAARLVRRCVIDKAPALDLGQIATTASTGRLHPSLAIPEPRPVALKSEPVVKPERTAVVTGSSASDWSSARAPAGSQRAPQSVAVANAPVDREIDATEKAVVESSPAPTKPSSEESTAGDDSEGFERRDSTRRAPPTAASSGDLRLQEWTLGSVLYPPRTATIAAEAAVTPLTVVSDEWALIPELAAMAVRRMSVRLDDRPLLAGNLTLIVDGRLVATEAMAACSPGQVVHLRLAEDDGIYVDTDVPWQIDPTAQKPTHQRHGRDRWVWNLSDQPRTMRVYLAMPVSRSKELTVSLDAATTAGSQVVEPGVLRWDVVLAPGTPTRIGLGWQLDATGGLHL